MQGVLARLVGRELTGVTRGEAEQRACRHEVQARRDLRNAEKALKVGRSSEAKRLMVLYKTEMQTADALHEMARREAV